LLHARKSLGRAPGQRVPVAQREDVVRVPEDEIALAAECQTALEERDCLTVVAVGEMNKR
jgi:hypothetical protein